jgi:anthranilate/para-aminobenzoate synthase component II
MERYLWGALFMLLGIAVGGLFVWRLFGQHRNLIKIFAWMGDNCDAVERAAIRRVMMTPGHHDPEDIRVLALVIRRAPEDIQQLLRQAARDVSRLEGEG